MNYLIVGLGNPGKEYENTRHNAGVVVIERLQEMWNFPSWSKDGMSNSLVSRGILDTEAVSLMFPQTFMNLSGTAVRHFVDAEYARKLVVVYDDLDIPLGSIKVSYDRSSGGHNGVQSIMDTLGSAEFLRVRIGIGALEGDVRRDSGVLDRFTEEEKKIIESQSKKVAEVLIAFLKEGKDKAMLMGNTEV